MLKWKEVKNQYGPRYLLLLANEVKVGSVSMSHTKQLKYLAKTFLPDLDNKFNNLFVVAEGDKDLCVEELIKYTKKWFDLCGYKPKGEQNDK